MFNITESQKHEALRTLGTKRNTWTKVIYNTELAGFRDEMRRVREISGLGNRMPFVEEVHIREVGGGERMKTVSFPAPSDR